MGAEEWGEKKNKTGIGTLSFNLEKEMATHSSILAWRIPGTEEPGGLLFMGLHRVGHDCSDLAAAAAHLNWILNGNHVSLLIAHQTSLHFSESSCGKG